MEKEITLVSLAINTIKRKSIESKCSLQDAAIWYSVVYRAATDKVMDQIGFHPSSEPELRALQSVF